MKARWIYFAVVSTLIISLKSYAQIPVSDTVSGTWYLGNTYEVIGDIIIPHDSTLLIEPGVVVKFMGYYRFYVYGLLLANGTATDSIYFTCDLIQNPNKWGGIRFTNANSLCSMSYCVIERGLAQNPEPHGGGIYCFNSSPTFSHCVFNNNSAENDGGAVNLAGSSPTFSYCDFYNNHSDDCGGGIAIYFDSSPELNYCNFTYNTSATHGGGIRVLESSPIFNDCIINDNSANSFGGVSCSVNDLGTSFFSEFTNCQFSNNYAEINGGGIGCYGVSLTLDSCSIVNNYLSGGTNEDGGGIYAENCNLTLLDCDITGNYNASRGGGMFLDNDTLYMTNCTLSNNTASSGGGIYLNNSLDAQTMTGCTISNNSASNGGGIYLYYSTIGLTNCEFSNNTAAISGGGIYAERWWVTAKNCTFIANSAPGQNEGDGGGGIYLADNQVGTWLNNCLFEDNSAYRGGGIYGYSWSSTSHIDSCTFINNSADPQGGGAIFNSGADVSISECEFEGNQCTGYGGGIKTDASPTISKCVFINNIASLGGGIFSGLSGSPTIVRCTLYGNSAASGGGIACLYSSPEINSTIVDSSNGSGIYFDTGSSSSVVKYCDFNNNFPIDFSGSDIPTNLGTITNTNYNDDPCDAFSNIFLDPLFVDVQNGNFNLQAGSPCIDAGDPNIPLDPDGTISDMGCCYHHHSGATNFALTVSLTDGWNMVSVPGLHPMNQNVETWWAGKDPGASVFKYSGGYLSVTTTLPTEGYWMKNLGAQTYNYPAIQIVPNDPINAPAGWCLIGGYENSVAAVGITTDPPGLIGAPVYKFSGGYQEATTIDPGYGYWIKLDGAGDIIIPVPSLDDLEDIGPDCTDSVTTRIIDGVTVTLSTQGGYPMLARTYNENICVAFTGENNEVNNPLNHGNVSGTRFISSNTGSINGFPYAEPIIFQFNQSVTFFGLTTIDLCENDDPGAVLKLQAFNQLDSLIDEHIRIGPQGPSGLDLDWSVSGSGIIKVLLTGNISEDYPGYGIDDILVAASPLSKGSLDKVEYFKEEWGRIIITDNAGIGYTLYAVKGEVDLNKYELPPAPPSAMFDVRYGSGRIAEDLSKSIQSIKMSGIEYPVRVKVENISITLQDESGKEINAKLKPGEEITIENNLINKLLVYSGELIVPIEYALEQNYPNPFNPSTTIKFSVPKESNVNLSIYNVLGELVLTLVNEEMKPGYYEIEFDASTLASGIYLYSIKAGDFVETKKMVLMK